MARKPERRPLVGKCEVEIKAAVPDPFELAKAIRRGEKDDELPDYEVLTGWLQRVPVTWLPALLAYVVTQCVVRNVFQTGKMLPYCERAELLANDPTSILRKD